MAWKKNYTAVRNANWITYLVMAFAIYMAASGVHESGGKFGIGFVLWVAFAFGLAISVRNNKRKLAKARG